MLEALPLDTLRFFNIHLEILPPRTKSSLQIMALLKTSSVVPLGHHSDTPANRSKFCLSGKYPCLEKNLDCYSLPATFKGGHVTQFWPTKCKGSLFTWKDRGARRKLLFSPLFFLFWMLACEDVMAGTEAAILWTRSWGKQNRRMERTWVLDGLLGHWTRPEALC